MIHTSGKVVGNIGEQWKEARDNCVKKTVQQEEIKAKTGKEIVPVEKEAVGNQQVHVTNKFAVLEVEEGEKENNNQLVLVEDSNVDRSPNVSPSVTRNGTPKSAKN